MKPYSVTIQLKVKEQYFPVVLYNAPFPVVLLTMPHKAFLIFEKCDHSNESYEAVFSCGAIYCSTFIWFCLICCTRWLELLSGLWMKSFSETI